MIRQQKESTWPFLCLLACMFVLSAMSPRPWQRLARSKPIGEVLREAKEQASAEPVRASDAPRLTHGELALAPPVRRSPPVEPANLKVEKPQLATPAPAVESQPFSIPVEPSAEASVADPEAPVSNTPSRKVAPHSEVLAPLEEKFPLLASMPSLIAPLPSERTSPVKSAPLPKSHPVKDAPRGIGQPAERSANDRLRESIIADTTADSVNGNSAADSWEPPIKLLADLDGLAAEQETGDWVQRVRRQLESVVSGEPEQATAAIDRLEELAGQVETQADKLGERPLAARWRRARYALRRRLDIWKQALTVDKSKLAGSDSYRPDPQHLSETLGRVEAATGKSPEGRAWREFLLLDSLRQLGKGPEPTDEQQRIRLAKRILDRLSGKQLDPGQRQFLASGPLASLGKELYRWTVKPVDRTTLLRNVERFEQSGLPSDARRLAEDRRALALSTSADRRQLARLVDGHYRNANLRIAVSEELINRLMPIREPKHTWVNETVLGNPIQGHSRTSTDVGIRLIPDPNRLLMALEVNGRVASLTSSDSGPATFFNDSQSTYTASKPIEFSARGVRTSPAEVDVRNVTRLRNLETDFDRLPLFGSLAKSIARSQHHSRKSEVQREVERKVARRAKAQIDTEADARFGALSQRLEQRVIRPIAALSLGPEMISAQTTESRLITRIRLADEDQLGAHTPRPRAPSDSLASLQLHQSALNNTLEQLGLAGRSFTLPELRRLIATRFNRPEAEDRVSPNDDVTIAFAKVDPIVVRCHEGRVEITLSVTKLRKPPRRSWRDFQIRVFYRPKVEGLSIKLVRDGIVQLSGKRLDTGSQIAVRGVFSKTFSKHRPLILTPTRFIEDPRLEGLAISQFVIDDGWIGLALGPDRTAPVPAVARR